MSVAYNIKVVQHKTPVINAVAALLMFIVCSNIIEIYPITKIVIIKRIINSDNKRRNKIQMLKETKGQNKSIKLKLCYFAEILLKIDLNKNRYNEFYPAFQKFNTEIFNSNKN